MATSRWVLHGLSCVPQSRVYGGNPFACANVNSCINRSTDMHMGITQLCMYTIHAYVCISISDEQICVVRVDTQIPCFKKCLPLPGQWQVLWRRGSQRRRQLRHVAARRHWPWLRVAGRGLALQPAAGRRSGRSLGTTSPGDPMGEVVR